MCPNISRKRSRRTEANWILTIRIDYALRGVRKSVRVFKPNTTARCNKVPYLAMTTVTAGYKRLLGPRVAERCHILKIADQLLVKAPPAAGSPAWSG